MASMREPPYVSGSVAPSRRSMSFRVWVANVGAQSTGDFVLAEISHSIIGGGIRSGILVTNLGTANAQIEVSMVSNRVRGGTGGTPLVFIGNAFPMTLLW